MKWYIWALMVSVLVFFGVSGGLAQPGSAQIQGTAGNSLDSQDEALSTPTVTPSLTATPAPVLNNTFNNPGGENATTWFFFFPYLRLDPSPTPTSTPTPTPTPTRTPRPPHEFLVCSSPGQAIPDGATSGLRADITLGEEGVLLDLDIYVRISHTFVGDVAVELVQRNVNPLQSSVLLDRAGLAANAPAALASSSIGCQFDNIQTIFDSGAEQFAEDQCAEFSRGGVAIGGMYKAQAGLEQFRNQPAAGVWSLLVADPASGNTGKLDKWCLHGWVSDVPGQVPPPTPPPSLPSSKIISGVTGQSQSLPLSCESRSAVDWAKFFNMSIGEIEFLNNLPVSDNPDVGFVGDVNGTWGQIPPNPYGVHAEPVAKLLRDYGLTARGFRGLKFDDLRAEIAKGHPVIVWIAGNVERGAAEYFQAPSNGGISIVARYEHTVIVYGYDASNVYVQNGGLKDAINIDRFLDSWSALGNMAVMALP